MNSEANGEIVSIMNDYFLILHLYGINVASEVSIWGVSKVDEFLTVSKDVQKLMLAREAGKSLIFFTVTTHRNGHHITLLVYDSRSFYHFDSLGGRNDKADDLARTLHTYRLGETGGITNTYRPHDGGQQNGYDCGVYVLAMTWDLVAEALNHAIKNSVDPTITGNGAVQTVMKSTTQRKITQTRQKFHDIVIYKDVGLISNATHVANELFLSKLKFPNKNDAVAFVTAKMNSNELQKLKENDQFNDDLWDRFKDTHNKLLQLEKEVSKLSHDANQRINDVRQQCARDVRDVNRQHERDLQDCNKKINDVRQQFTRDNEIMKRFLKTDMTTYVSDMINPMNKKVNLLERNMSLVHTGIDGIYEQITTKQSSDIKFQKDTILHFDKIGVSYSNNTDIGAEDEHCAEEC